MGKFISRLGLLRLWPKVQSIFDWQFYLRKYPDVSAARLHPLRHFLEHGATEGRKPCALFDPDYYRLRCPEAQVRAEPAVLHFLHRTGERCASPHPLFDCASYVRAHPEARHTNPLAHYLRTPRTSAPEGALKIMVMDAELAVVFRDSPVPGAASVWEDSSGRLRFLAPPEQAPFFRAMKYDQLRAQIVIL